MYPPISWISATGEYSSRWISASTASRSSPTRPATRSLRTCSSVGVGTRPRRGGRRGLCGHALTRADLAAARRRAVLGDDLRKGDERVLVDESREREGDLVLLHPDVLRLARHVAEARVLDQEPAGLGGFDRDGRIAERRDAERLAHGGTAGERQDQREPQREAMLRAPAHNGP